MNNKSFANKAIITTTVLAVSLILLMGPTSMTLDVFAQGNSLNQGIGQSQASTQLGICVSGDGTLISCNNLSVQDQDNEGNNAAAQSGGNDDDDDDEGGNSANQGIGQSQESEQSALCVSGEGTFLSCNNLNFQNQENSGSNALAQQSGNGGDNGGNSANQGIGQSQSSSQSSGVVSGDDSVLSGNNLNFQNQENSGSNAAAQSGGNGNGNGNDDDDHDDDKGGNDNGGNSANQGIGQSQESEQSSGIVSGDDSVGSGNNVNIQNQENEGNNAAAQQD